MCRGCWEDEYGAPTELPENGMEIVDLIKNLYEQPDGVTGGPLHVALDDMNLEPNSRWVPYLPANVSWAPRTVELATQIAKKMLNLSVDQRAAVIGKWEGYF